MSIIIGTGFVDTLIGTTLEDVIRGLNGNDSINGGAGDDLLLGGPLGEDTLQGGTGDDTIEGGYGDDSITGGDGNDVLRGEAGDDTYFADNFDTIVEQVNEGTDTIITPFTYTLPANVENLILSGTGATLGTGNGLNNYLQGNSFNNRLSGSFGNDTLSGGGGNDTVDGGADNDVLRGGSGSDSFVFGFHSNLDSIADFGAGDSINLSQWIGLGVTYNVSMNGADTLITSSAGDVITVVGVHSSHLSATASGFVYV